jgi:hypothetical protein
MKIVKIRHILHNIIYALMTMKVRSWKGKNPLHTAMACAFQSTEKLQMLKVALLLQSYSEYTYT